MAKLGTNSSLIATLAGADLPLSLDQVASRTGVTAQVALRGLSGLMVSGWVETLRTGA